MSFTQREARGHHPQGRRARPRGRGDPSPQHHADDGHDDDLARRLHLPDGDERDRADGRHGRAAAVASTDEPLPEKASTLIITPNAIIVVEGKTIVSVTNGDVDPAREGGRRLGIKIPRLTNFLATSAPSSEDGPALQRPGTTRAKAPPPELMIIADRTTPYRLLVEVMFSAKQKEAGYKHFRLIVQKTFPAKQAPVTRTRLPASRCYIVDVMKLVGERRALAAVIFAFYFLHVPDGGSDGSDRHRPTRTRSPRSPASTASRSSRSSRATSGRAGTRSASACTA